MQRKMEKDKIISGDCWVVCFDILGFSKKVKDIENYPDIFVDNFYRKILETSIQICNSNNKVLSQVHFLWFSDTFVFVTEDDSFGSYVAVNLLSREFFDTQIKRYHPLQGAISVGKIYYSKDENIIIGMPLIDAYKWASGQNWIGFILTPSADEKLKELNHHPDRTKFVRYNVPFKDNSERLFAYNMDIQSNRENLVVRAIRDMQKRAKNTNYKVKYDNTIKFVETLDSKKR